MRKGPEPGSLQGPLQGAAPRWAQEADGAGADGGPEAGETEPGEADELIGAMLSGATYGVLFVLGVFLGLVGALAHAWGFVQVLGWEVPVGALGWLVVLFGVPYAMGWLMETRLGAIVPAVGWGLISAVLAVQRSEGDLLIAANAAGYAYLYGGMLAMAAGVLLVPSQGSWLLTPRLGAPPPGGPQELPR